jgi:hypothetical protein
MNISHILPSFRTVSLVSGAVCIPAALEMALRALKDLGSMLSPPQPSRLMGAPQHDKDAVKRSFSANLGGAVFYGLCATNLIPGTPIVGAVIFAAHSVLTDGKNSYISWAVKELCQRTYNHILVPAWNEVIGPLVRRIYDVIVAILARISLPRHPIWYGVALLAAAIWIKYGTDLPALMNDIRARLN